MTGSKMREAMQREIGVVAPNYHPLPVVLTSGNGSWVTDVDGTQYLDALAGYSAVNFGHSNPRLQNTARRQLDRLTMTSRAFYNDQLGTFCRELAELADMEMVLPMNTGAEAVETAIKVARKWGYEAKGVQPNGAEIIVMGSSFHGRTTTIISFSDDEDSKEGFGPYTPGFVTVPFSDIAGVEEAVTPNTVAVMVELIQGEAGVILPDPNYPKSLRDLCTDNNVLLIVDEIQSGLGRTGYTFASELYGIKPDLLLLGKALGGGILPVSAVIGRQDVLGMLTPGTHGSTFGGNPLAAAIGTEVVRIMREGTYQRCALEGGERLGERLEALRRQYPQLIQRVSRVGLWAGIEFNSRVVSGREVCEEMLQRRVLVKDAHGSVVRVSPPLSISSEDIEFLCDALEATVSELARRD